jgi:CheY-like chemotaxis protein
VSLFGAKPTQPCNPDRILIVDDEAPIRKLFQMILASALPDLNADQARNGIEAVRLFNEQHHGVIMMDLRMPEMDGLQAFFAIQKACQSQTITMPTVIFCTGYVPADEVNRIVGDNAYHCLIKKPVRSEDVIGAVMSRLSILKQQSAAVK